MSICKVVMIKFKTLTLDVELIKTKDLLTFDPKWHDFLEINIFPKFSKQQTIWQLFLCFHKSWFMPGWRRKLFNSLCTCPSQIITHCKFEELISWINLDLSVVLYSDTFPWSWLISCESDEDVLMNSLGRGLLKLNRIASISTILLMESSTSTYMSMSYHSNRFW